MGFLLGQQDISRLIKATQEGEFWDAQMLTVMWETRPEIVRRLLPAPLSPAAKPLVTAFVAHYPKTSFSPPYYEGALFLRAAYGGIEGGYCISMPVTDDTAMALGREVYGYPKKLAKIRLTRKGDIVEGSLERHGQCFFKLSARLTGATNTPEFAEISMGLVSPEGVACYNVKHFLAPGGDGFDYKPRLVRERVVLRPTTAELGVVELTMSPSEYDPWAEVEVVKLLGGIYTVGDNIMLKGDVVAEMDTVAFMPHSFVKWDVPYLMGKRSGHPVVAHH